MEAGIDGNMIKVDLVKHLKSGVLSSLGESWPGEFVEHCCYTVGTTALVECKPSGTTLHHFYFVDEMISMGVPDGTTELQKRSNQRLVGLGFQFRVVDINIPSEKSKSTICFGNNTVNMFIPPKILSNCETEVFNIVNISVLQIGQGGGGIFFQVMMQ